MSLKNFLPLNREIRNHWVYKDNDFLKLWVEILFAARFSEEPKTDVYKSQLYTIEYGQFLFSRRSWSDRLDISESKVRTFITLAKKEEMIVEIGRVGKRGATIYSVTNYKHYNNYTENAPTQTLDITGFEGGINPQSTHKPPTNHPPVTHQPPVKKNVKKKKKNNNYTVEFENLYKIYPNSKNKQQTFNNYKALLKTHKHDELLKCAERYAQERKGKDKQYTTISSNFFGKKAVYLDYLDENYQEPVKPAEYIRPKKGAPKPL